MKVLLKYFVLLDEVDENEISGYIGVPNELYTSSETMNRVYKAYQEEKAFDKKEGIGMGVQIKRVIIYTDDDNNMLMEECIGKPRRYKGHLKFNYHETQTNPITQEWLDVYKKRVGEYNNLYD